MLSVIYAKCQLLECCKQAHYDECRYAEYRYAECRGALVTATRFREPVDSWPYVAVFQLISSLVVDLISML
jgi:hypothetical protein